MIGCGSLVICYLIITGWLFIYVVFMRWLSIVVNLLLVARCLTFVVGGLLLAAH